MQSRLASLKERLPPRIILDSTFPRVSEFSHLLNEKYIQARTRKYSQYDNANHSQKITQIKKTFDENAKAYLDETARLRDYVRDTWNMCSHNLCDIMYNQELRRAEVLAAIEDKQHPKHQETICKSAMVMRLCFDKIQSVRGRAREALYKVLLSEMVLDFNGDGSTILHVGDWTEIISTMNANISEQQRNVMHFNYKVTVELNAKIQAVFKQFVDTEKITDAAVLNYKKTRASCCVLSKYLGGAVESYHDDMTTYKNNIIEGKTGDDQDAGTSRGLHKYDFTGVTMKFFEQGVRKGVITGLSTKDRRALVDAIYGGVGGTPETSPLTMDQVVGGVYLSPAEKRAKACKSPDQMIPTATTASNGSPQSVSSEETCMEAISYQTTLELSDSDMELIKYWEEFIKDE